MTLKTITIALEPEVYEWASMGAKEAGQSVEAFLGALVKDERARRALDSMAAWVREDEAGPTNEEIDRVRADILGDGEG